MPAEKVSLDLAVRYAASDTDLDDWRRSFARTSEILYYATDGQIQFGNLFVTVDAADDADADAFLCEHPGRSYSIYDHYMNLCRDEQVHPLVIVHEFGHFFFNLGDEYPTKVLPAASCIGNPDLHACIMEFDEEGDLLTETGIDEGKVPRVLRKCRANPAPAGQRSAHSSLRQVMLGSDSDCSAWFRHPNSRSAVLDDNTGRTRPAGLVS